MATFNALIICCTLFLFDRPCGETVGLALTLAFKMLAVILGCYSGIREADIASDKIVEQLKDKSEEEKKECTELFVFVQALIERVKSMVEACLPIYILLSKATPSNSMLKKQPKIINIEEFYNKNEQENPIAFSWDIFKISDLGVAKQSLVVYEMMSIYSGCMRVLDYTIKDLVNLFRQRDKRISREFQCTGFELIKGLISLLLTLLILNWKYRVAIESYQWIIKNLFTMSTCVHFIKSRSELRTLKSFVVAMVIMMLHDIITVAYFDGKIAYFPMEVIVAGHISLNLLQMRIYDVVVPGQFIAFCMQFDMYRMEKLMSEELRSTKHLYFGVSLLGYFISLIITSGIVELEEVLPISQCITVSGVLLVAWLRKEMELFWKFDNEKITIEYTFKDGTTFTWTNCLKSMFGSANGHFNQSKSLKNKVKYISKANRQKSLPLKLEAVLVREKK